MFGLSLNYFDYRSGKYGSAILSQEQRSNERLYVEVLPGFLWTTVKTSLYDREKLNTIQQKPGTPWDPALVGEQTHRFIRPVQLNLPQLDTAVMVRRGFQVGFTYLEHLMAPKPQLF